MGILAQYGFSIPAQTINGPMGILLTLRNVVSGTRKSISLGIPSDRAVRSCKANEVDSIAVWSQPTTKKQVKTIFGLVDYYCQFIPTFSSMYLQKQCI